MTAAYGLERIEYWHWQRQSRRNVWIIAGTRLLLSTMLLTPAVATGYVPLWLVPLAPYAGYLWSSGQFGRVPLLLGGLVVLSSLVVFEFAAVGFGLELSLGLALLYFVLLSAMWRTLHRARVHRRDAMTALLELNTVHMQLRGSVQHLMTLAAARTHLAREIHDGVGHHLTVLAIQLDKALAYLELDRTVTRQALHDVRDVAAAAIGELACTMRGGETVPSTFALRPSLAALIATAGDDLAIDLHVMGPVEDVDRNVQFGLFRVVQEALTNIHKHARATRVALSVAVEVDGVRVLIEDNGQGFPSPVAVSSPVLGTGGYGLPGMHERLRAIGGHVVVTSRPGVGTRVHAVVPHVPALVGQGNSELRCQTSCATYPQKI